MRGTFIGPSWVPVSAPGFAPLTPKRAGDRGAGRGPRIQNRGRGEGSWIGGLVSPLGLLAASALSFPRPRRDHSSSPDRGFAAAWPIGRSVINRARLPTRATGLGRGLWTSLTRPRGLSSPVRPFPRPPPQPRTRPVAPRPAQRAKATRAASRSRPRVSRGLARVTLSRLAAFTPASFCASPSGRPCPSPTPGAASTTHENPRKRVAGTVWAEARLRGQPKDLRSHRQAGPGPPCNQGRGRPEERGQTHWLLGGPAVSDSGAQAQAQKWKTVWRPRLLP